MTIVLSPAAETVFLSTPVVISGVFAVYVILCIVGNRNLSSRIPVRIMAAIFLALSVNSLAWFINIVVASQVSQESFKSSSTCIVNAYLMTTIQYGITAMLTFVIADQYIACTMPLRYRSVMTLKKGNRVIAGAWGMISVFEIPLLVSIGGSHGKGPIYFPFIGVCYASYTSASSKDLVFMCWSIVEVTFVYVMPIYVMVHLSYNSYRVMNHRKRANAFSAKAEQELKEQNSKIAKLVEKHDKTDKDKNESLKAILSLYAKPMVKTALILFFVITSLMSHTLLRFYDPIKSYFGNHSAEAIQLTVNCLLVTISLGLILCAGRIVGSLQLIILRSRY